MDLAIFGETATISAKNKGGVEDPPLTFGVDQILRGQRISVGALSYGPGNQDNPEGLSQTSKILIQGPALDLSILVEVTIRTHIGPHLRELDPISSPGGSLADETKGLVDIFLAVWTRGHTDRGERERWPSHGSLLQREGWVTNEVGRYCDRPQRVS
jgi:hypothetical protein